jgi:parallel beta-helix repeat protein
MDYWGDNALVQYNVFRNIGADCVMVTGNNIAIRNNLFDNCAAMTSDQGAIYMTGVEKTNRVISNNIILNTIGTWSGLPGSRTVWTTAEGIYFDEPCSGVTVSGNTVAGIANGCGIKLHETHDVIITNNTLYNNYQGLMCQGSGSQPNDPIRNVALSGNKIIALSAGQYMWVFWSAFDDISQFGTATGQWYARPVDDGVDQDFFVREPDVNNGYNQWLTYAQMIARTGETNSTFSSVTATSPNDIRFEYNAAKTNKVITLNGNYRDVKGTAYSGSVTLAPYTSVVLIKG